MTFGPAGGMLGAAGGFGLGFLTDVAIQLADPLRVVGTAAWELKEAIAGNDLDAPYPDASWGQGTAGSDTGGGGDHQSAGNGTDAAVCDDLGPCHVQPLALDLNGDGHINLVALKDSRAFFDSDADGYRELTGWLGRGDADAVEDGFLVADLNSNGEIEGQELALSALTAAADTDLEALKARFDSNNDGVVDSGDADWGKLRVWIDRDQDGRVDAGELSTLAAQHIVSIDVGAGWKTVDQLSSSALSAWGIGAADIADEDIDGRDVPAGQLDSGAKLFGTTRFTRSDGSTDLAGDVALEVSPFGYKWQGSGQGGIDFDAEYDGLKL
jgi:hypothetical protein